MAKAAEEKGGCSVISVANLSMLDLGGGGGGVLKPGLGQIHVIGDPGKFYTVIPVDDQQQHQHSVPSNPPEEIYVLGRPAAGGEEEDEEEEEDILVCGRCKLRFSDLENFVSHKAACRKRSAQPHGPAGVVEAVGGGGLAAQRLILPDYMCQPGGAAAATYMPIVPDVLIDGQQLAHVLVDQQGQAAHLTAPAAPPATAAAAGFELAGGGEGREVGGRQQATRDDNTGKAGGQEEEEERKEETKVAHEENVSEAKVKEVARPVNKMETGEKKLYCSYCHKGFNKTFDLSQHIRYVSRLHHHHVLSILYS